MPSPDDVFERLLIETEGSLRAYLAGMGVRIADIDDLTQDAYLEYHLHPGNRPAEVEPIRWLKGIARNLALVHLRKQARGPHRLALLELLSASTDDPAIPADDVTALRRCVEGLSAEARQVLDLHYRDGEPTDSIGDRLHRSGSAVRKLLIRTRELLYACLSKRLGIEVAP